MHITSALFEAYLKCPTKCFLRSQGEQGTDNAYAGSGFSDEEGIVP
jgi:hypothetical protein